jgi:hypothetical protein
VCRDLDGIIIVGSSKEAVAQLRYVKGLAFLQYNFFSMQCCSSLSVVENSEKRDFYGGISPLRQGVCCSQ